MPDDFQALVLRQQDQHTSAAIERLQLSDLPAQEVLVKVDYSSLNYKDAMALCGKGKIVREYPMVPGIDLAGTVLESSSARFHAGQKVLLTGWAVGERLWGGYSQRQRVKADWLVPMPEGMDSLTAMKLGTAGLTAMLCVMALQDAGVHSGDIVVSGASGGVGSVAVALLAQLGYRVSALSQRPQLQGEYLRRLGAAEVIGDASWQDKPAPLATQRWHGAIDVVGGQALARILSQCHYGGAVAACGLAGGVELHTTVMPFILRGVRLLGVDSVSCPQPRREQAWQRLAQLQTCLEQPDLLRVVGLQDVQALADQMMAGQAHARVVVDVNR